MLFNRDAGGVEWIVVGLGNPGKKYESTRHNMGFLAVDGLADKEGFRFTKLRFKAWTGEWRHNGKKVLVMKPQGQCPLRAILDYPRCYLVTSQSISSWKGWACVPGCYSEKFHFLQLIRWDPWPFLSIGQEEQTGMETVSSFPHSPPYLSSRKQSLAHSVFFLLTFPCSKGR